MTPPISTATTTARLMMIRLERIFQIGLVKVQALGQTTLRTDTGRLSHVALAARRNPGVAWRHKGHCAANAVPVVTLLRKGVGALPAVIAETASRSDPAKLARPRRRRGAKAKLRLLM